MGRGGEGGLINILSLKKGEGSLLKRKSAETEDIQRYRKGVIRALTVLYTAEFDEPIITSGLRFGINDRLC